jgi:hypothetical protein
MVGVLRRSWRSPTIGLLAISFGAAESLEERYRDKASGIW